MYHNSFLNDRGSKYLLGYKHGVYSVYSFPAILIDEENKSNDYDKVIFEH